MNCKGRDQAETLPCKRGLSTSHVDIIPVECKNSQLKYLSVTPKKTQATFSSVVVIITIVKQRNGLAVTLVTDGTTTSV